MGQFAAGNTARVNDKLATPLTAAEVEVLRITDGMTGVEAKHHLMHLFCSGHLKLAKGNMTRAGEFAGLNRDNLRKYVISGIRKK